MSYLEDLEELKACGEAMDWLQEKAFATPQEAWDACTQGHWMSWLLVRTVGDSATEREKLVIAGAECLSLCDHIFLKGQVQRAKSTALDFLHGKISKDELYARVENSRHLYALYDCERHEAGILEDGIIAFLSMGRWPTAWGGFNDVVTAVIDALDPNNREITAKKCADIIRKHFPSSPIRQEN